jgi:hypothetical protein
VKVAFDRGTVLDAAAGKVKLSTQNRKNMTAVPFSDRAAEKL